MQVYGTTQLHGAQGISAPHSPRFVSGEVPARPAAAGDQLDISAAGELASRLSEIPDIRADRVAALRAAIAEGTYETDDKLSLALDRLLDEIA